MNWNIVHLKSVDELRGPTCPLHSSFPLCVLLSLPVLTMVQVQQEETTEDPIQAVTGVYGLCCSHLVQIQKKKKKCFCLLCFTSAVLCCCLPLSCLTPPPHSLLLSSLKVFYTISFSFIFIPPTHFSLCLFTYAYRNLFQLPLSSCSLLFLSSSRLSIIPLFLAPSPFFSKLIALSTLFSSHQPLSALLSPT